MGIKRAIATNSMKPAKRFLRQLLPRLLESAVGVPPCGVAVTLCAIIAPTTLPKQTEVSQRSRLIGEIPFTDATINSNGVMEAAIMGNFAMNLLSPLGVTQN